MPRKVFFFDWQWVQQMFKYNFNVPFRHEHKHVLFRNTLKDIQTANEGEILCLFTATFCHPVYCSQLYVISNPIFTDLEGKNV